MPPQHCKMPISSGATDVFRPAGLIRACRLLHSGRWMPPAKEPDAWTCRRPVPARMSPTRRREHPWHQISVNSCIMGTHFQVKRGKAFFLPPNWRLLQACAVNDSFGLSQWRSRDQTLFTLGNLENLSSLQVQTWSAASLTASI